MECFRPISAPRRYGDMDVWRHRWRIYQNEKTRGSVRRLDLERTKWGVRGSGRKEIGAVNCASAEPERTKQYSEELQKGDACGKGKTMR